MNVAIVSLELHTSTAVRFWTEGYNRVYTRLLPCLWMPTHGAQKQSYSFSVTLLYLTAFRREHRSYLGENVFDTRAFTAKKWMWALAVRGVRCTALEARATVTSSRALTPKLSQAWIPSSATLALLGSTKGQLHPLEPLNWRQGCGLCWRAAPGAVVQCAALQSSSSSGRAAVKAGNRAHTAWFCIAFLIKGA